MPVPLSINLEIDGDKQAVRTIQRVGERAQDATPAFDAILSDILFWEEEQFETEGGASSGGWAPLKPETVDRKLAQGLDPRILHATLALEKSLTQRAAVGAVRIVMPQMLVFGSTIPYAGVHQNPRPENPLPRRRPVEFREDQRHDMAQTLQMWIVRGTTVAGQGKGAGFARGFTEA